MYQEYKRKLNIDEIEQICYVKQGIELTIHMDPIDKNSIWFSLEGDHVIEIGTDYDLACFYDNYRENHCKSLDDIKDDILDDYIYYCQIHAHDDLLGCEITELNNDGVKERLEQYNLNIDSCTVIGDMYDFNDDDYYYSWLFVECNDGAIYIYQDWDQVWENIIYDLFPAEWLKDFAK